MTSRYQRTLQDKISLNGIGLHTGIPSQITINPAKENSGLLFKRIDISNSPTITADVDNVVETNRGTVLESNGNRIHTVEHILAALAGLNIDNAIIELSDSEPPIMDGSSYPFVQAINDVGIDEQSEVQDVLVITEPLQYSAEDNVEINILPSEHFKITFFMDYGLPNFGLQYTSVENVEREFAKEIAPARTFGLLSEVADLKHKGLIQGGSLENSVVFVDKNISKEEKDKLHKLFSINSKIVFNIGEVLNNERMRFENEPVRHKVLDLIGDLALFGKPIIGHIIATRSGHSSNIEFVKQLREANNL